MKDGKIMDLTKRTKEFALMIIRIYSSLSKTTENQVLGKQLLKSGTSVGAHYREAYRARSNAEFISKLEGGLQELEETHYLLELLIEIANSDSSAFQKALKESDELIAIFITIVKERKLKGK
ncbi:MAG: four helix bundle protein [Ignavibacteriales bacterium]|nr:four helix bundle protein [Ignavibacteriales bacterium]